MKSTSLTVSLSFIVMLFLTNGSLMSQEIHMLEYTTSPDHSNDIDKVGQCVLKNELKGDILTVELLSRNMQYSVTPKFTTTYKKGILRITPVLPTTKLKDTVYYDKVKKKNITMHGLRMDYSVYIDGLGPKAKREVFRLKGFKSCPKSIFMNDEYYPNCPEKDVEYMIYQGYTINRINANGYKQGLWITFYDTGEIHERKQYVNGSLEGGKTYDKNGKDLHYIGEFEHGIGSMRIDSIDNK